MCKRLFGNCSLRITPSCINHLPQDGVIVACTKAEHCGRYCEQYYDETMNMDCDPCESFDVAAGQGLGSNPLNGAGAGHHPAFSPSLSYGGYAPASSSSKSFAPPLLQHGRFAPAPSSSSAFGPSLSSTGGFNPMNPVDTRNHAAQPMVHAETGLAANIGLRNHPTLPLLIQALPPAGNTGYISNQGPGSQPGLQAEQAYQTAAQRPGPDVQKRCLKDRSQRHVKSSLSPRAEERRLKRRQAEHRSKLRQQERYEERLREEPEFAAQEAERKWKAKHRPMGWLGK